MSWSYYPACEAVLALAQLEDRRRQILGCECGALYLTSSKAPGARECGACWRRATREADEAADRAAYERYLAGGGGPLDLFRAPKSEPQVEPTIQGVLF